MKQSPKDPVTGRATLSQAKLLCAVALALGIAIFTCQEVSAASVSPASITFQAVQGGANPSSQTITVDKGNNSPGTWTGSDSAAWLSLSPGSGSMKRTAQVTLSVNASGLAAGTYTTIVSVDLSRGGSVLFPVTLTIRPATTTTPTTTNISSGTTTSTTSGTTTTSTAAPPQITSLTNLTASGLTVTCANQPASIRYQTDLSSTVINPVSCNPTYSLVRTWVSGETFICVYARSAAGVENTIDSDYRCVPKPTTTTSSTTNQSAILSWTLGTESDLAGYKVYVGTASGSYNYPGSPFTVGKVNTYTISSLPIGQTYFFAISAYNSAGFDSAVSAEVSKSIY